MLAVRCRLALALSALVTIPACQRRAAAPATRPATAPATQPAAAPATQPAAARTAASQPWQRVLYHSLLAEAARAEHDVGGTLIDLGTPDQYKYTRGGWGTGWGPPGRDQDGTTYAALEAASATLRLAPAARPRLVVVRLRAAAPRGQLTVHVNGREVGTLTTTPHWRVQRVAVPAAVAPDGVREIRFTPTPGRADAHAHLDWVWLAQGAAAQAPAPRPYVAPVRFGTVRRALVTSVPGRASFYFEVPAAATLTFGYGADRETRFVVRATDDVAGPRTLFEQPGGPRWAAATVDLGPLAGRTIRLDLITRGKAGRGAWSEPELWGLGPRPAPAAAARPARGALVIVVDALRADLVRSINPASAVPLPAFEKVTAEGTTFATAYANAPWTLPAVTTMLTGAYPDEHGNVFRNHALAAQVPLLPEKLRAQGFRTAAFMANPVLRRAAGLARGWDTYRSYGEESLRNPATAHLKVPTAPVLRDVLAFVEQQRGQRFFAYVHLMGPHLPYRAGPCTRRTRSAGYRGAIGPFLDHKLLHRIASGKLKPDRADWSFMRDLYEGEATCQDRPLAAFLEQLAARGLLDDTLLVLTADHGEELGERGLLGHGSSVHEEQLRVPLVMRYPAWFPRGHVVREVVEHVDLAPTILDVLGLGAMPSDGLSALPLVRGGPGASAPGYAFLAQVPVARAVSDGRWKLCDATPVPKAEQIRGQLFKMWWQPHPDGLRLYDLRSDPGERVDRASALPITRRAYEILLGEAVGAPPKRLRVAGGASRRATPAAVAPLDPALKQQLEALGY